MYQKFTIICIAFLIVSVISAKDPESKDQPNTTEPKWKRCSYPYSYQTIINGCIEANLPQRKQGLMTNSKFQAELQKHDNDLRTLLELCGTNRHSEVYQNKLHIYKDINKLLKKTIPKRDMTKIAPCYTPVYQKAFAELSYACGRAKAQTC